MEKVLHVGSCFQWTSHKRLVSNLFQFIHPKDVGFISSFVIPSNRMQFFVFYYANLINRLPFVRTHFTNYNSPFSAYLIELRLNKRKFVMMNLFSVTDGRTTWKEWSAIMALWFRALMRSLTRMFQLAVAFHQALL